MAMTMMMRAQMVMRMNDGEGKNEDKGEGKWWQVLQICAIREREREIKEDLVRTSEHEGATVASLAYR
jgi:hypothetical protein